MRRKVIGLVGMISVLGSGSFAANDLDELGLPTSSEEDFGGEMFMEEQTEIDLFRRKLRSLRRWAGAVQEMEIRYHKMYNERVVSASEVLKKIHDKIKNHPNKVINALGLDKDARHFEEVVKSQGMRRKLGGGKLEVKESKRPEYTGYRREDENKERIVTGGEVGAFVKAMDVERNQLAVQFIINEKLDLLERMGYPELNEENIDPVEQFCIAYNNFLRRDVFILLRKRQVSGWLSDYAKKSTIIVDHYAKILDDLKLKKEIESEVDFKRVATDMRNFYTEVTRGRTTVDRRSAFKFYVQYLNDIMLEERHIQEIPEVNMRPIRRGLDSEERPYTQMVLLEQILEALKKTAATISESNKEGD